VEEQPQISRFLALRTDDAFSDLFVAVYPKVRRYFLLRHQNEAVAEELAQIVLFKVYQKADELKDESLFQGWLFAIARNELLQHWRKQQSRIETVELEPLVAQLAHRPAGIIWSEFQEWLSWLEPNERELVLLRFVEGLTYEELGAALGVPLGTVESRLFSVRKKLLRIKSGDLPRHTERKQPTKK
jgi:RNA polymerase sigma-70 factor (ECF subfamily)